ncbi:MAG: amidohydrolase family protein [Phycisphaerae bacterium]|nr:amidohydrolase family protein [Phycisphaerae bacterium]
MAYGCESSPLSQAGRLGRRLQGETVLDAHAHMGSHFNYYPLPDASLEQLVGEMDRHGVRRQITFSLAGVNNDFVYGNSLVHEMTSRRPERFWPLALISPRYPELILPELRRCAELGFRGVKLITAYQGLPEDTPLLNPAYEFAAERGWIVLSHSWGTPGFLYGLARRHPQALFIDGHGSCALRGLQRDVPENVLFCTLTEFAYGVIERFVNNAPLNQIVFGSDMPDLPLAWGLGAVLMAKISDDAKRRILGVNLLEALYRHGIQA